MNDRGVFKPPSVPDEHYAEVKELIQRVGGIESYSQFLMLLSGGWDSPMAIDMMEQCVSLSEDALAAATSGEGKSVRGRPSHS